MQKKEELRRQKEEERRKEEEESQRKWEEQQLERLDVQPYVQEIEMCEFLLKYCQKQDQMHNGRLFENKALSEVQAKVLALKAAKEQERRELEEKRRVAIEEQLQKGKLMRAEQVSEKRVKK
jgi:hypothetical protein